MRILAAILVLMPGLWTFTAMSDTTARRVLWGVDDAGAPLPLMSHPKAAQLFEEFGFDVWVMHYRPSADIEQNIEYIQKADEWCKEQGIYWVANLEHANWVKSLVDERGRDWHNREDGRHFFLFPDEILQELGRTERLLGLMYDEAAHMQNCRNKIAKLDKPWIFDPEGQSLETAADRFTEAVAEVARRHNDYGLTLYTEHVFPVLFHALARGGWVAGTKILKENWSPAYIACALGAALQYDTGLWITPDLWGLGGYPGHSVEEYRSALLLAYHMGADCIYTENLAFDHENKGNGSLVLMTADDYEVTEYGQITKWFVNEYMSAHPRGYSYRDIRPRVAIVRQPDACWGQRDSWLPDWLFGHKEWQSNDVTEAWLDIWHVLSGGVISEDSLSWHNAKVHSRPYQVFCPLDGVVVFDHHVGREHLEGVEVIFLTGVGVSEETLSAIEAEVAEGATCVSLPHLVPERVRGETGEEGMLADGAGKWVVTEDFKSAQVGEQIGDVIPDEDVIRYRFGETVVTFRPVSGDPNRLDVRLQD